MVWKEGREEEGKIDGNQRALVFLQTGNRYPRLLPNRELPNLE